MCSLRFTFAFRPLRSSQIDKSFHRQSRTLTLKACRIAALGLALAYFGHASSTTKHGGYADLPYGYVTGFHLQTFGSKHTVCTTVRVPSSTLVGRAAVPKYCASTKLSCFSRALPVRYHVFIDTLHAQYQPLRPPTALQRQALSAF